jgi:hypothetical protein
MTASAAVLTMIAAGTVSWSASPLCFGGGAREGTRHGGQDNE